VRTRARDARERDALTRALYDGVYGGARKASS
jgi:hypothetical protein